MRYLSEVHTRLHEVGVTMRYLHGHLRRSGSAERKLVLLSHATDCC